MGLLILFGLILVHLHTCHDFATSMRCNDRDLDVDAFFLWMSTRSLLGCGRGRGHEQLRDQQHPQPRRPQSPHRERRKVGRGQVLILSNPLQCGWVSSARSVWLVGSVGVVGMVEIGCIR